MSPPVRPNRRSRSPGPSTWEAMTDPGRLGAYAPRVRSTFERATPWSTAPDAGAYWVNAEATWAPGGASEGSTALWRNTSMNGREDIDPAADSSHARWR